MGIGGKSNMSSVFGNKYPKAAKSPKIAPEAPNIGELCRIFN